MMTDTWPFGTESGVPKFPKNKNIKVATLYLAKQSMFGTSFKKTNMKRFVPIQATQSILICCVHHIVT
mgnify:CR=1 FL=1